MAEVVYLEKFTPKNLAEYLNAFAAHLRAVDRGASSGTYLGAVRAFGRWADNRYGAFFPPAVSPLDMVEYRDHLQSSRAGRGSRPLAPATVNKHLIGLRVFFGWLVATGQVRDNPVGKIRLVATGGPTQPKWLTRNEQAALVRAVMAGGNLRDMAIIGLMLHAGLRVAEVCAVDRADLDVSERKGVVRVRKGKGNKYREVPLNNTVRKILSEWLAANPAGPLFPNRRGHPISVSGVEKMFAEYVARARPPLEATPHSLRHTFCRNLLDRGVSLDQVAALAGHSSLDVTKRYTAPSAGDLRAAVDRIAWE
ncbi:MAG: tyrosine-type recombinase/integrase [Thermoplasmatales archaeon]